MKTPIVSGLTIVAVAALLSAPATFAESACNPQLIQKETKFPLGSQLRGQRGTVHVNVVIDANGRPQKAALHRSSGYRKLDRAAARSAIDSWVFDISSCKPAELPIARVIAVEYHNDAS